MDVSPDKFTNRFKITNIVKVREFNEDLTKSYKDYVRIACTYQMKICGHNIFEPVFKWNILTVLVWTDIFTYLIVNAVNIWIFWGDMQSLCYCLVTYGFGFTGLARVYYVTKLSTMFYETLQIIYGFSGTFDHKTDMEEIELYKKYGVWCKRTGILSTIGFSGATVLLFLYPAIFYIAKGEKALPYGFIIPGISYTENPGYAINVMFQSTQTIFVLAGFMLILHVFFLFVMNASFQVDMIIIKIQKLDHQITAEGSCEEELEKIVKLYQNFITFMGRIETMFRIEILIDFMCFIVQNVITLYVLIGHVWTCGYIFIVMIFVLLLIPSIFGTMIEVKNDKLINAIYDIAWHEMQVKERKTVRFFLEMAQNSSMLSCGGFIPLNMILFQKTYNKIYTYLMFLRNTSA